MPKFIAIIEDNPKVIEAEDLAEAQEIAERRGSHEGELGKLELGGTTMRHHNDV